MTTVTVRMGEMHVEQGDRVLTTFGVGSCVAVILYDPTTHIGGMVHAMLSTESATTMQMATHPLRYVELAIPALIDALVEHGAGRARLMASVVGGAQMFSFYRDPSNTIGPRNVAGATHALLEAGIPIDRLETGGTKGRNVHFNLATGACVVETK